MSSTANETFIILLNLQLNKNLTIDHKVFAKLHKPMLLSFPSPLDIYLQSRSIKFFLHDDQPFMRWLCNSRCAWSIKMISSASSSRKIGIVKKISLRNKSKHVKSKLRYINAVCNLLSHCSYRLSINRDADREYLEFYSSCFVSLWQSLLR